MGGVVVFIGKEQMIKKLRPAFKSFGGKFYLANWIINQFPDNYQQMDYLEPYCSGASVLLNKQLVTSPGGCEIISDLDVGVINVLRAIRDQPKELITKLKKVKYNEATFNKAQEDKSEDYLDKAVNEFILRRMSRGGLKKSFAWSDRERGGQPGDVNAWKTIIKLIPDISNRLSTVHILNKPALELIKVFNSENTMLYCDPPYLPETRVSKNAYEFEMSEKNHIDLANILNNFRGKVILSGYQSKLYKKLYKGWKASKKVIANHASQQKIKPTQTEMLWLNY
jgi:DNA adenine methylase